MTECSPNTRCDGTFADGASDDQQHLHLYGSHFVHNVISGASAAPAQPPTSDHDIGHVAFDVSSFECWNGAGTHCQWQQSPQDMTATSFAYSLVQDEYPFYEVADDILGVVIPLDDSFRQTPVPYSSPVGTHPLPSPSWAEPSPQPPGPFFSSSADSVSVGSVLGAPAVLLPKSTAPEDAGAAYRTARLRTSGGRKSRRPSTEAAPDVKHAAAPSMSHPLSPERARARFKHKHVEKQYRDRLSAQFERLLAVLPAERFHAGAAGDEHGGESDDPPSVTMEGGRVTRAEVLEMATRIIEEMTALQED